MTIRFVIGVLLLAVGIGLPLAAVSGSGVPWEFRERAAVVLERVGTVENQTAPGEVHRVEVGEPILAGHEIRVGPLSEVRLRTRTRTVFSLGDASRATVLDEAVRFNRGLARVEVPAGSRQAVEVPLLGVKLELKPGVHLLLADGRDHLSVLVEEGEASAVVGDAPVQEGRAGQLLTVLRGKGASWGKRSLSLTCRGTCERSQGNVLVKGAADPGSQVFVNGRVTYPDRTGAFQVSLPLGQSESAVSVFARDASGNVCKAPLRCAP